MTSVFKDCWFAQLLDFDAASFFGWFDWKLDTFVFGCWTKNFDRFARCPLVLVADHSYSAKENAFWGIGFSSIENKQSVTSFYDGAMPDADFVAFAVLVIYCNRGD